jgi:hypothetical protein
MTGFPLLATNVAALEIAKRSNFNLNIPTNDENPKNKFLIQKKFFAIACHTNMASKNNCRLSGVLNDMLPFLSTEESIMEHIQEVFDKRIQYICISSAINPSSHPPTVYIHITLKKRINKKTYFMEKVAGICTAFVDDLLHYRYSDNASIFIDYSRNAMQLQSNM